MQKIIFMPLCSTVLCTVKSRFSGIFLFLLIFSSFIFGCSSEKKSVLIFEDTFERAEIGKNYEVQGGDWRIENGKLKSGTAKNRNLVLKSVDLPQDGIIELTMKSHSDAVDVKFNLWGDGKIHDHGDGYTFILGGWNNRISVISKLHEHEKKRSEKRDAKLEKEKLYKIRVERISNKISWFVNGGLFLEYNDETPLKVSEGFSKLSFANWKSDVEFDDLKIYALEEK